MILIADNIQPANPRVAEAMERLDPGPIRDIARRCREAGAEFLDINPGFLTRRKQDRMAFLVETVQEEVDLPLVLDSPNPDLLTLGLAACRQKNHPQRPVPGTKENQRDNTTGRRTSNRSGGSFNG